MNALSDRGQMPLDEVEDAGRSIEREPLRRLLIAMMVGGASFREFQEDRSG